jgi:hypothetical protein
MINLRERLIVDYSTLKAVATIINNSQTNIILTLFTMAILFEFFGEWNFLRVLKRLVVCFLILGMYENLFRATIDFSFSYSNIILDNCKKTEFCSHYLSMKRGMTGIAAADSTLWHETVNVFSNFSSYWIYALVSLIFKFAFVFTIQIYSLVYAISSVTYPLICSVGLLPVPGEKAFVGIFQTLLWLFLSPIFLSIIIVLLAGVTDVGIGPKGEVGLEGLLHLMVISLFSLGSLFLTWNICNGSGVAAFGSQLAQMGTMVLGMAGVGAATSFGKQSGGALGSMSGMASKAGVGKFKDYVSKTTSAGLGKKGIELTPADIGKTSNGFLKSSLVPKGSEAYGSLSKKEKMFHAVDSVINAKENNIAKFGMIKDLKNLTNSANKAPRTSAGVSSGAISATGPTFKPNQYKDNIRKSNSRNAVSGVYRSGVRSPMGNVQSSSPYKATGPNNFSKNINRKPNLKTKNNPINSSRTNVL